MKYCLTATALLCASIIATDANAKTGRLASPDGNLSVIVSDDTGSLCMSIARGYDLLLSPSQIGIDIQGLKANPTIKSIKTGKPVTETIASPFYRQSEFETAYTQMTVTLTNSVAVEFRAYDQGIAYRFVTNQKGEIIIDNEIANYAFPSDVTAWLPYSTNDDKPMAMAYQNVYDQTPLSQAPQKLAFLPATFDCGSAKLTLTESDLEAYPGMFIQAGASALTVKGVFAPYPATTDFYPWRKQEYVTSTESYIAKTEGKRALPWRIWAVTTDDRQMPVNNLVYALASPNRIGDTAWIKGGKEAWDWWNDWGLKQVPFKAGINMETYKYYIDFASENGIEYVVLDEGWYDPKSGDMLTTIPEINLPELIAYGRQKNVDLVLWTVFNVLDSQLIEACKRYSEMGIKGFKVDFLDRDDQTAVEMVYRIAQATAEYQLFLDLHGIYKPTGLNRTYPNVINFESVFGMEEVKWTDLENNMPLYDVTFPYIRLLAGPVDYTPGAMRNATKADWKAIYYHPMSMGTRCHQLATYIVYDSPFTMLCDAPSNYKGEEECVRFMVGTPTDIDETLILSGKMGESIVTARRSGRNWWVGGLTNWDARDVEVDFSFLPEGQYQMTLFRDGPNANKNAEDYAIDHRTITPATKITIPMASGGGFALQLRPL